MIKFSKEKVLLLHRLIAEETEAIDFYDPYLTLDGLRILYEKNKNR